jgi:2-haloacid dehalogenase
MTLTKARERREVPVVTGVRRPPRALLFDVFGTCVDWRTSVVAEGEALASRLRLRMVDWPALADAWRARYQPQLETVRSGARPWTKLDVLHREALEQVLAEFGLDSVPEADRNEFNRVWHRLAPWQDTVAGLRLLKRRFIIAPNSNGHIALVLNLSKRAGMVWDAILGSEIARAYKPAPEAYVRNVEALDLSPPEVMMVAAHNDDLVAAAACGLRTAFVPRPTEHGPGQTSDLRPHHDVEVVASDFIDLAHRLGAARSTANSADHPCL